MSDIEVNVESTNRQIDVNLVNPSAIDAATRERGPAGSSGSSGTSGTSGSSGLDGNFGGASFKYSFSTNIQNTDPGAGDFKFNSSTQNQATRINISSEDLGGSDISTFLRSLDDSYVCRKTILLYYLL